MLEILLDIFEVSSSICIFDNVQNFDTRPTIFKILVNKGTLKILGRSTQLKAQVINLNQKLKDVG